MKKFRFISLLLTAFMIIPFSIFETSAEMVTVYEKNKNIAQGKSYTASEAYTATPAAMGYQDVDGKELTDGKKYTTSLYDTCFHGFYFAKYSEATAVIDLGSVNDKIIEFRMELVNQANSGIDAPSELKFAVSEDGKSYTVVGEGKATSDKIVCDYVCKLNTPVKARYVKAIIGSPKSGVFVFCSEFEVYDSKEVQKDSSEVSMEEEYSKQVLEDSSEEEKTGIVETGKLDLEEYPLDFVEGSRFSLGDGILNGVRSGDTPASICKELVNMAGVCIVNENNQEITTGNVYTGCKLVQYCDKKIAKEYTIIIPGDISGKGEATSESAEKLKDSILGKETLTEIETKAADIDKNGSVTITDYIAEKMKVIDPEMTSNGFEEVKDSEVIAYPCTLKKSSASLYTLDTVAEDGTKIKLTFDKKTWGMWNIGTWSANGTTLAGGGTDWEYVYRACETSTSTFTWSGGNHGNELFVSLKFFDGVTGEEVDLSAVGSSHEFQRVIIEETSKLHWGDEKKTYCDVIRRYSVEGSKISLDVTYDYTMDAWFQLSYTCMFPVPKINGLYIEFLKDDGTYEKDVSLKVGAADYSGPFYGKVAASACKIYGYKNTRYSFIVQSYTKKDSVENFAYDSKLMYWDMNSSENKLYFSKFDASSKTKISKGTHLETSCSWEVLIGE